MKEDAVLSTEVLFPCCTGVHQSATKLTGQRLRTADKQARRWRPRGPQLCIAGERGRQECEKAKEPGHSKPAWWGGGGLIIASHFSGEETIQQKVVQRHILNSDIGSVAVPHAQAPVTSYL